MKKGTLLSIALVGLLGFGVASCDNTSNPTSVAPTTSETTAKYTSVAITNKEAFNKLVNYIKVTHKHE